MMTDMTWSEFCELYYETAKKYAEVHLQKIIARNGNPGKHVDLNYVVDAAVLSALEKTYSNFDASRGAKITTYLSRIVHNDVADEFKKESKRGAKQDDIEDLKGAIRSFSDEMTHESKERLIERMRDAITRLSDSDQVILGYWLDDKSTYVSRSAETLGTTEEYVTQRRFRIFKMLPQLMGMTRKDYLAYEYTTNRNIVISSIPLASVSDSAGFEFVIRPHRPNPILPGLNIASMAEKMVEILGL